MRLFRWVIAVLALVAVAAAACGGDGDEKVDLPGGGEVNVSDDLPDDFPDDFPIYDGADFEGSFSGEQDGVSGIVANWTTGDDIDDVRTFYDDEFSGDGEWTAETDGTTGDSAFWSVRKGDQGAFVTVASDGDQTSISVVISNDLDLPADDAGDSSSDDGDDSGDDSSDDGEASDPDDSDTGDDPGSSGDAELPDEVDLPDDFPSDVPLPDDVRVTNAFSSSTSGVDSFIIEFMSQDSIDDLRNHFKDTFEGQSWTQAFQSESNGQVFDTYAENADNTGTTVTVTIYESDVDGYNTVGLTVSSQ